MRWFTENWKATITALAALATVAFLVGGTIWAGGKLEERISNLEALAKDTNLAQLPERLSGAETAIEERRFQNERSFQFVNERVTGIRETLDCLMMTLLTEDREADVRELPDEALR